MKNYRIVIAGCGHMSYLWVDYVRTRSDCTIVALVDISSENAQRLANEKQLQCPFFTSVEDAIVQTNANLVFDITIPASHFKIASTALSLGCDVFSEKPLAESFDQCVELFQMH